MKLLKQTAGAEKHGPIPADFCTAQLKRTLRPQWAPALSFIIRFCLRMAYSQILCLRNMFLQKNCYKNGYTVVYNMGKFSTILRASLTDRNKVQPQRVTTSRSAACLPQPQAPSACPVQAGSGDADVKRITSRMFQETWSEHEKMMNGLIMELSWNYHSWKHVPGVPGECEWFGNQFGNGLSTEFETRPVPVSPLLAFNIFM
jgi:hypothetical protein